MCNGVSTLGQASPLPALPHLGLGGWARTLHNAITVPTLELKWCAAYPCTGNALNGTSCGRARFRAHRHFNFLHLALAPDMNHAMLILHHSEMLGSTAKSKSCLIQNRTQQMVLWGSHLIGNHNQVLDSQSGGASDSESDWTRFDPCLALLCTLTGFAPNTRLIPMSSIFCL